LTVRVLKAARRMLFLSSLVLTLISSLVLMPIGLGAGSARADGPVGADPPQNFPAVLMPISCNVDPTSPACIDAAVGYLDQARASLGQNAYGLPSNFDALAPEQQAFVLTNLDRVQYGLTPIPGLTAALGQDAAQGVRTDSDPMASDPDVVSYTSNWAGGYLNMPLAYEAWMYDDGPGSGNLDCTPADARGCWGHRHDILWQFDSPGPLAMGAAAGQDTLGQPGYAMLIVEGDSEYKPVFTYTWNAAVAAGARPAGTPTATAAIAPATVTITVRGPGRVVDQGGNSCAAGTCSFKEAPDLPARFSAKPAASTTFAGWSGACSGKGGCTATPTGSTTSITAAFERRAQPPRVHQVAPRITRVKVAGHTVRVAIAAPKGARLQCTLTHHRASGWARDRWRACSSTAVYRRIARGSYRIRVRSRAGRTGPFVAARTGRVITVR
jgi:hypothetical protein